MATVGNIQAGGTTTPEWYCRIVSLPACPNCRAVHPFAREKHRPVAAADVPPDLLCDECGHPLTPPTEKFVGAEPYWWAWIGSILIKIGVALARLAQKV